MERDRIAGLLLVAVLATMSLVGFLIFDFRSSAPGSVEEALGAYSTPLVQRLYPAADARSSAVELQSPEHKLFITYKDRSTEDVVMVPGGSDKLSSLSYYPEQPGESGRRPHIKRLYGAQNMLIDEKVLQLNGLLLKSTEYVPATKTRLITDFALDGSTHLREQVFTDPGCCSGEVLMRDEQWRDDVEHSLAYRNIYHPDDTRTITRFDEHMNVLTMIFWPKYESISGMKIQKYYPDTLTLRLDAVGDYYNDTVKFFRKDGTLEALVKISTGSTEIHYFDATGTKARLEQFWFRSDVKQNGVVTSSTYKMYYVTEFDAQGNKVRQVTFSDGSSISRVEAYDVTIDGVHYLELDYNYDRGALKEVRYWKDEVKFPPYKLETHELSEQITASPVSAENLRLQIQIDSDLPAPPPQSPH